MRSEVGGRGRRAAPPRARVSIEGNDVQCNVLVGGELRSRKGLNLPVIDLGACAFTEHDRDCLKFATENGVDAVSQSFVETATDIASVRRAATQLGGHPFIIAKTAPRSCPTRGRESASTC